MAETTPGPDGRSAGKAPPGPGQPTKADQRRMKAAARAQDEINAYAYERGEAGDIFPEELRDDSEARQAYNMGRRHLARRTAGGAARQAARHTKSIGGSIYRQRGQAQRAFTGSGSTSFAGLMVGALAVILLYVALTQQAAVTRLINGVRSAVVWLVSPSPLPF